MKKKDPIHKSKRVYAALIVLVLVALRARGIDISEDVMKSLTEQVGLLVEVSLGVAAITLDILSKYQEPKH